MFSRDKIKRSVVGGTPVTIDAGDQLFPYFVNEAAYYEKGVALAIAKLSIASFEW